jgi:type I restriction enzyme S subunit
MSALPDGYKMTELGPLPAEWRVVKLGDVADLTMGQSPPSSTYNTVGKGIPFLQGKAEFGEIYPKPAKWCSAPLRIAKRGSVLVSVRAPVGDANLANQDFCIGRGLAALSGKQLLVNEFLFFYLLDSKSLLEEQGTGSTFKSINKAILTNFPIPLLPLAEQRAIAEALRAVQEAQEATGRVIAAARELKQSLMRHLFTYGPVPVEQADRVPMQETELGPLPAHWRVVRLGEVVSLRKGTISPAEVPNARYIGLEHIDSGEITIKRFGHASDTKSAKAIFQAGDILYGKLRPYLDKAALAEWGGVCSTDILVLIPLQVDPLFGAYLMHSSHVLNHAIATTTGVNHPRTSWKALSQCMIPLPPLAEQREIARILQTVDEKIRAEEARRQALEALFKTLLHDLMTARRRLPVEFITQFNQDNSHD